jgi:hypothetical protein
MHDDDNEKPAQADKAFQDDYPDNVAHCYGCGRLNPDIVEVSLLAEGIVRGDVVAVQMPKAFLTG